MVYAPAFGTFIPDKTVIRITRKQNKPLKRCGSISSNDVRITRFATSLDSIQLTEMRPANAGLKYKYLKLIIVKYKNKLLVITRLHEARIGRLLSLDWTSALNFIRLQFLVCH